MQLLRFHHIHISYKPLTALRLGVASAIFPPGPPPFFPLVAIKLLFAELDVNRVVSLAHPPSELFSTANPWRIAVLLHPCLEILPAIPARVELREGAHEGSCLYLERWGRVLGILGCDGMKECPRGTTKGFNVGRAVRWKDGWRSDLGLRRALCHGKPRRYICAGSAAGVGKPSASMHDSKKHILSSAWALTVCRPGR